MLTDLFRKMVLRQCDGVEREQDLESVDLSPRAILLFTGIYVLLGWWWPWRVGSLLITQTLSLHTPNGNKYTVYFAGLLSSSNDVTGTKALYKC